MRSWLGKGLIIAGAAAALTGVDVSAAGKTAAFKVTAVQSTPQGQITMTSQVWVTSTQARADMHHPLGGDMRVLVTPKGLFQLDPKTKRGIKGKVPPAIAGSKDNFEFLIARMAFNGAGLAQKGKKIRTENAAGYLCDVYTHTASKQGQSRTFTVWLPQKMNPKFAVKAVIDSSISKPGVTAKETFTIALSDIKLNQPIAASTFAVPTGYKVVEGKIEPPKAGG